MNPPTGKFTFMQTTYDQLGDLVNKAKDIAETKAEIFKLKATHKISVTASTVITIAAIAFIAVLTIVVLSIGLAILIGNAMESMSSGFFIVGGFYLLVGLILALFRKQLIETPLSNIIIDKMIH